MKKSGALDRWIFESYSVTAEGLGILRIFTALFILFFLIPGGNAESGMYLEGLPDDFFAPPPGPMMLFDGFPPGWVFQAVHTVIVASLIAMLVGYRTRPASVVAGLSILVYQGFFFSLGKVNHEAMIPLVPVVMAFSNWGIRFSVDSLTGKTEGQKPESWPLTLMSLFIGFMMFTAGFPKILGGWLDPATEATKGHLFNQYYVKDRTDLLAEFAVGIHNNAFWGMLDWLTILFEVGFLVTVMHSGWFRMFVCFAVLFHFSTMMTLNISFLPNFLGYAVFLNWNAIYKTVRRIYQRWTGKTGVRSTYRPVLVGGTVLAVLFALIRWVSRSNRWVLTGSDLMLHEVIFVSIALLTVIYLAVKRVSSRVKSK